MLVPKLLIIFGLALLATRLLWPLIARTGGIGSIERAN